MSKYNKIVVFNYVMGNDIEDYNIEELENDWEFMKEVFDYTNDKKIYDLCDDKLKSNFNLVKYLINKYKDDQKYVLKIASNYLEKAENKLDKLEIKLMLDKLFKDDDVYVEKYDNKLEMQTFYFLERTYYELALDKTPDDVKEFMQYGFYWFFEQYKDRELITDFIAKKMVDEIFDFRNKTLEEIIHSIYKDKSKVDKISSTKFIIDYISNHDYALSNYISVHVDIIKDLKKSVDLLFKNFNYYKELKYRELIDGILYYIENFSEYYKYNDEEFLKKCIAKDLKNKDISKYALAREEFISEYPENADFVDEYGLDIDDVSQHETIKNDELYIKLLKEVKRLLENEEIYYGYKNKEEMKNNFDKGKILKFEPKNK